MRYFCAVLVCAFLLVGVGCTGSVGLAGLVPVQGVVTYNGAAVEGANVLFAPASTGAEQSRAASAITDASGKFTLMTLQPSDGAFPGEYKVTITKQVSMIGNKTREEVERGFVVSGNPKAAENIDKGTITVKNFLPAKYASAGTSGLILTVPARGDKNVAFALSD